MSKIKCILLAFIIGYLSTCESLKIAVIGAGPSGIVSAKRALDQKHNVTIFEKTGTLGGVWYYTEETDKDEYGVEIHSPTYRDLKTNIHAQYMAFDDYKHPNGTRPFLSHKLVFKYLNSYADKFHVRELIRFHHLVDKVVLMKCGKWHVTVLRKNLPKKKQKETHEFDAVLVCSGINFEKRIPKIDGASKFKGKIMHSRAYRKPETFVGEDVLVIGRGPSSHDIARQLYDADVRVVQSSYKPVSALKKQMEAMTIDEPNDFHGECQTVDSNLSSESSNVKRFKDENRVEFEDGTCQKISVVIYATGYKYSYPFLDASAGIHVKDNFVEPLYMHVLNVEHPTMAFIGVAHGGLHFPMYDLQ
ncbi:dimethylaniline monooxygenase [N-oxide-forming] 3-like, partial [Contarinia nasturtii]|uniref:dimethylaniline monooxygenase [N-oxide-forming] 3-like n=1 Tax=Contarinia nasturtii TaxID=265458 RepID=UPI0012D4BE13